MTRGMAGEEAAEVLQHAAEQTAQGADEDADQRADVAASSRKHASTKRLSDEAHLGRALIKATQEERVRPFSHFYGLHLKSTSSLYDNVDGESI